METELQLKQLFQVIQSEELELFHINELPEINMDDLDNEEILHLCGRWVNHIARIQYIYHKFCQEIYGDTNNMTTLARVCCFVHGWNEEIYRVYEDLYEDLDTVDGDLLIFIKKEMMIRQIFVDLENKENGSITLRKFTNIISEVLEDLLKSFSRKSTGDGLEIKGWIKALYRAVIDLRDGVNIKISFET